MMPFASRRSRMPSPTALIAGLTMLGVASSGAGAQSPTTVSSDASVRASPAQFRDLRWLEGTWRGRMPDGKYFYERYVLTNDSTIRVIHFADSTLATPSREETIALRGGAVRYGGATAIRLDASGIAFAAPSKTTPDFTFTPAPDGWTATIHRRDQNGTDRPVVYDMRRYAPPPADPAVEREAVRRAVLDYVEGFYEGDTTKLLRAMWPDVRKYGYSRDQATGVYRGMVMSFPRGFMDYANSIRLGRNRTPPNAPKDITIYDVQDQTASAKLTAWWGTDYLLLAKENGRWMITHVLWQSPPRSP